MTEKIKDAKLRDLNARAERAQARYEEGEKELFRADGSKLYSEDEHRQRVRALAQERNGVLRDIEQQAYEMKAAVASEVERIENADPADSLTPEELEHANQKRAFALDAAETLDPEKFKKRLEAVLAAGDKGSIFAHYMAGQHRSKERNGRVPFRGVLERMEAALGGDRRASEVEKAKRKEGEALQVELLAGNLKVGARSSVDAYMNKTYGYANSPGR